MTHRGRLCSILLAATVVACSGETVPGAGRDPDVPEVDTAEMEPQVAAMIEGARRTVASSPASASSWGRLGMILHAHSLYDDALPAYERASELAPDDYRWAYLAALARQKSRPEEALEDYRRAAALTPDNPAFYINYAHALELLGRPEEAGSLYEQALSHRPDSSHALYGLARRALADGDLERSLELLEKAARLAPAHGEIHALLAQVHQRRGEPGAAERATLLAMAYPDPSRAFDPVVQEMEAMAVNSRAMTARGLRLIDAGRFAEAEKAFRRVLEVRPGNARDYANLGGALARQGKFDEAIESYRRALEIDPSAPDALNNLALALAERGDLDGAREQLEAALAADPAYAQAYLNRALLAARAGDMDGAMNDLRRAIELAPGLTDAYNQLGTLLAQQGRLEEAAVAWESGLIIAPGDLPMLYNLALAEVGLGEHTAAVGRLRTALGLAPNSSRLARVLAWELATAPEAAVRNGEEAISLARRVLEAYPGDPEAADALAAALAEAGRYDEATAAAEQAAAASRRAGRVDLAAAIESRLSLYRSGRPYRQPS